MSFLNDLATKIKTWADSKFATISSVSSKQDTLVSGTNIKTINNNSLLGSGNLVIGGGPTFLKLANTLTINSTNEVEITDFAFNLVANATYIINFSMYIRNVKPIYFYLDFPLGCTGNCAGEYFDHNSGSGYAYALSSVEILSSQTRAQLTINRSYTGVTVGVVRVYGLADIILNTTQSGTFTVKTKIATAGNITELISNSYLSVTKV